LFALLCKRWNINILERELAVTIHDIAKAVGKSYSTVSRALADHPRISEKTKNKVVAAAKELKYYPSFNAKALRRGKTNTIGMVIPDIINPFYTEYLRVAEQVCLQKNYQLLVMEYSLDSNRQRDCLKKILENGCDGAIVFIQEPVIIDDLVEEFCDRNIPVVNGLGGVGDWNRIVINFAKGIETAIDHLVSLGHREIVMACSQPSSHTDKYFEELRNRHTSAEIDRNEIMESQMIAFEVQLKRHRLHFGEESFIVSFSSNQLNEGAQAAKILVNDKPLVTAVLAQNDFYATGLIHSLIEQGVSVPEDISVIGFDNSWQAKYGPIPLTTIDIDTRGIAEMVAEMIFDEINNVKTHESVKILFDTNLIIRDSTAKIKI
jgi:LacI family transcriptional regulator